MSRLVGCFVFLVFRRFRFFALPFELIVPLCISFSFSPPPHLNAWVTSALMLLRASYVLELSDSADIAIRGLA